MSKSLFSCLILFKTDVDVDRSRNTVYLCVVRVLPNLEVIIECRYSAVLSQPEVIIIKLLSAAQN